MADHGKKCKIIFCIMCLAFLAIIMFIACFSASFHYVSYNEYGFKQDRFSNVDLSHIYEQGRYLLPLNYVMIKLPSTYQLIEIESSVFSDLGLEFDLHLVVYYQLPKENLGKIYRKFSVNYEDRITNIVKTTIKDIATSFSVDDYVVNRTNIEAIFSEKVHSQLTSSIGIDIDSLFFRLLRVTFPESVIESSLKSAIELQNNKIRELQQEVSIIEADTAQIIASIEVQSNSTIVFANIESNKIIDNSLSEANRIITEARGEGIKQTLNILKIVDPNLRNEFIHLVSILDANKPKILSGDFNTLVQIDN